MQNEFKNFSSKSLKNQKKIILSSPISIVSRIQYIFSGIASNIGTLTAAHRYATHKSFKAKWPLRIILCLLQTLSGQKTMIEWARDHHTHHKYEGTNADVVNINRGFFFAHMGWLMIKRHPECEEKRSKIDVNYLWSDPIVRFQYNFYEPLVVLFCIIIPTLIPYYLFDESLFISFHLCFLIRYAYTLQLSFCGKFWTEFSVKFGLFKSSFYQAIRSHICPGVISLMTKIWPLFITIK